MTQTTTEPETKTVDRPPFSHIVVIEPLGFLYGSAGKFLSPENLVGRSGASFPPSAATLSGILAAEQWQKEGDLDRLQLAGPFWAWQDSPQNFYVPVPFNCLVKEGKLQHQLQWHGDRWLLADGSEPKPDKYDSGGWMQIQDWTKLDRGETFTVEKPPWKFVPHLHPQLKDNERRVDTESQGSLFLENAVQLNPDACLVYLTNTKIEAGWYRFGGEGHIVNLHCESLQSQRFDDDLGRSFAIVTPAVWGSNRLSLRSPQKDVEGELQWDDRPLAALLSSRPVPFRYRLGGEEGKPKRLSRGRYAVPAGAVYVLAEGSLPCWQNWPDEWFPSEGYSLKRWGCGLALPLAAVKKSK